MTGIYLAIATLAFALIIQQVFTRWEAVTGGFHGMPVDKPEIFGLPLSEAVLLSVRRDPGAGVAG